MFKVLPLALMLSLSMLMVLPGTYSPVRGAPQSGPTKFAPFGPFTQQMIIHYYSDFNIMFQHFQNGEIDISDWPLQSSSDIGTFCNNTDLYCTTAQAELGIFQQEINGHTPFMGIPLFQARTVSPATFVTTSTAVACSIGFGSLSISLFNLENNTLVKDSLNTLTASNQPSGTPSATVSDSGGSTPNGVYIVPCILAGTYRLSSSVYGGTVTVSIASNTLTTGTFNVNWNSPSSFKPTQARTLLGAAIGHLFDDPEFVSSYFGSVAQAPCGYAVLSQGVTCPTQAQTDFAECQFGNHPWLNIVGCSAGATGHDISPYNIADDAISASSEWWNTGGAAVGVVKGYSGHDDLRAACDDFVSMGLTLTPSGTDCNAVANAAAGTADPGSYPHLVTAGTGHILDYIRTAPGRQQFGQIVADTLDFLFGTPMDRSGNVGFVGTVCYGACPQYTPRWYTFTQVNPCVFEDTPASGGSPDCWQLYTAGQSLDPTPDQFFLNRNTINTGQTCAGVPAIKPNNYDFWCNPQSDTWSNAGEFATTLTLSGQFFQRELLNEITNAAQLPGFSFVDTFVENNGWNYQQCPGTGSPCANTQASLVTTTGQGTLAGGAYWTLLNARQVPGYNPCAITGAPLNCNSYWPGCTGTCTSANPNLIRRGFSQDTTNLSPFTFNSAWEGDFLSSVFDTMLEANPNTGGGNVQFIDWGTTSHGSRFNPNEIGCNTINGCAIGVTTQTWHLRNDWKFADGNDVKATDVAYSLTAYRDVPSSLLQGYVINLVSATGLDCGPAQPCKTLQVKLQGQGALFEYNIGATQFVLEKSLWAPYCGDPPIPGGTCASATFDPMYPSKSSPGIEVGTGPWACISPISGPGVSGGHIGGPCAETAAGVLTGGAIVTDGRILLSENTNFLRCCPNGPSAISSSLYAISYADFNNDGVVNILDLAAVASAYNTGDLYWCNPNVACTGGLVGSVNLATVAIYFGHGITTPYTPQTLIGVDPQIDPFFCTSTGAAVPPSTIPCV